MSEFRESPNKERNLFKEQNLFKKPSTYIFGALTLIGLNVLLAACGDDKTTSQPLYPVISQDLNKPTLTATPADNLNYLNIHADRIKLLPITEDDYKRTNDAVLITSDMIKKGDFKVPNTPFSITSSTPFFDIYFSPQRLAEMANEYGNTPNTVIKIFENNSDEQGLTGIENSVGRCQPTISAGLRPILNTLVYPFFPDKETENLEPQLNERLKYVFIHELFGHVKNHIILNPLNKDVCKLEASKQKSRELLETEAMTAEKTYGAKLKPSFWVKLKQGFNWPSNK